MKIKSFSVEQWMALHETRVSHNLAETCAESLSVRELLELCGKGPEYVEELLDSKLTYGDVLGSRALRTQIARFYPSRDPMEILVTHGAIEANYLVFHALVSPGDRVVVMFPAYQQLCQIPESLGARVEKWVLDFDSGFSPDFERLEKLVGSSARLVVINNPHNPTGRVFSEADLERIVSICSRARAAILCDEVYHGFFWSRRAPTMAEVHGGAVITASVSKNAALAGLRIGWIRAGWEILDACRRLQEYITIGPPLLSDRLALLALQNWETILRRNAQLVKHNLDLVAAWMDRQEHVQWVVPAGGTTTLLKYDFDIPSRNLCEGLIKEKSVLLVPGDCFEMEGYVRLSFGCATAVLEEGLRRMSDYLGNL